MVKYWLIINWIIDLSLTFESSFNNIKSNTTKRIETSFQIYQHKNIRIEIEFLQKTMITNLVEFSNEANSSNRCDFFASDVKYKRYESLYGRTGYK